MTRSLVTATAVLLSAAALAACTADTDGETIGSGGGETLEIWWSKGITAQEDDAARRIIEDWAEETGNNVEVTFIVNEDLPTKISSAVQAGNPPDIAFASSADAQLTPQLAADGELADVADVVEAAGDELLPVGIDALPKGDDGELYAVPVQLQTLHPFYRADLTEQAGLPADVPEDWDGFWSHWTQAQDRLRAQGGDQFGLGLPASTAADDGDYLLLWMFNAFGARLVDEAGGPVNTPENAGRVAAAFRFQQEILDGGYEPSAVVSWGGPDNNSEFERGNLVMTPNPTLSVTAGARTNDPEAYEDFGVAPWPTGPDGADVALPVQVKSAVVFAGSEQLDLSKDLLSYVIEPEHLQTYMEACNGVFVPVNTTQWQDPYWESEQYLAAAKDAVTQGVVEPWPYAVNPAFSQVFSEKVLSRALGEVLLGQKPADRAAQDMLDQIETILGDD